MFEEYLCIKGRPVIGRHMGIPIIVYFLMVYSEYHQLCCCTVCADCCLGCSTHLFVVVGGGYTGCLSLAYLDSQGSKGYINHQCPKTVR